MTEVAGGETTQMDAGAGEAHFATASRDGSRAFFVQGGELFECEVREAEGKLSCTLSQLTAPEGGRPVDVLGHVLASEDGSYVYFVANGLL